MDAQERILLATQAIQYLTSLVEGIRIEAVSMGHGGDHRAAEEAHRYEARMHEMALKLHDVVDDAANLANEIGVADMAVHEVIGPVLGRLHAEHRADRFLDED